MKVLVTGSTGHVGINLIESLLESDHEPIALVRSSSPVHRLPDEVTTRIGDITEPDSLFSCMKDCDAVVHLAALISISDKSISKREQSREEIFREVNVQGTQNIINQCEKHGIKSCVFLSTLQSHPDIPDRNPHLYRETKRKADKLFIDSDLAFEFTIFHPSWIIGPHDYGLKRFPPFQKSCTELFLTPPLFQTGKINPVSMGNVTASILEALETPTNNRKVLAGPNIPRERFLKYIADYANSHTMVFSYPFAPTLGKMGLQACEKLGIVPDGLSDEMPMKKDMGVVPTKFENRTFVGNQTWKECVKETYDWYVEGGVL